MLCHAIPSQTSIQKQKLHRKTVTKSIQFSSTILAKFSIYRSFGFLESKQIAKFQYEINENRIIKSTTINGNWKHTK